jgi:hypothetical protein
MLYALKRERTWIHIDRFIHSENIRRYERLLERVTDESQRLLLRLISEEKAKQPSDPEIGPQSGEGTSPQSEAVMPNGGSGAMLMKGVGNGKRDGVGRHGTRPSAG